MTDKNKQIKFQKKYKNKKLGKILLALFQEQSVSSGLYIYRNFHLFSNC